MSLRERFTEDLKAAMKAGDKARLGAVRLAIAAMKEKDVEPGRSGKATDEEIVGVLQKMIKQRQDSIEAYVKGNRPELAAAEKAEVDVLAAYLPKQMDEAAMKAAIAALIAEVGAASVKDMGKVMGALKAKFAGQMDFGKANGVVKGLLGG
jgi:hypothetical protein